jgi:hypothetical protein
MQHSFDILIAEKYGVNVAIFLNNIAFWIQKNGANKRHFYNDRYWTYNTVESYSKLFPYWSVQTLRTTIKKAINLGLLLADNFNVNTYDRTTWYALSDDGLSLFPALSSLEPAPVFICENQQMDLPESTNGFVRINQPIPDSKPDIKTNKTITEKSVSPIFATLKKYKIRHPKKPNEKVIRFFNRAIEQLTEKDTTLEQYLDYLIERCSDWLYMPWGERQRSNDELSIILKPAIINDALAGKFEDKKNVARN